MGTSGLPEMMPIDSNGDTVIALPYQCSREPET